MAPVVPLAAGCKAEPVVGAGVRDDLLERFEPLGIEEGAAAGAPGQALEREVVLLLAQEGPVGDVGRIGSPRRGDVGESLASQAGYVHRIEGVAEQVGGVDQAPVEVVALQALAIEDQPVEGRIEILDREVGPAAGKQEHHLAPGRLGEAAQGGGGRGHRSVELLGEPLHVEALLRFERHAIDVDHGLDAQRLVEPGLAALGEPLEAARRPLPGTLEDPLQLARGLTPVGQHLELAAVEGDHRHPILGTEQRHVVGQGVEYPIAVHRDREVVVDEHQIAGLDRITRRELRYPGNRRRLLRAVAHGDPAANLGEVVDRHLLAIDHEPEVARFEAGDR